MITRTVPRPPFLAADPGIVGAYQAPGVTIAAAPEEPGMLLISAPDEAAADAAEVWLAEMDTPAN
jgi:hypothetical protein